MMTTLSDTQAIILSAAAQRPDGNVLPLPGSLRGGAAGKVVTALLSRGLICEAVTDSLPRADAALNTVWRHEPDGRAVLLFVTPAGLEAIGVDLQAAGAETSRGAAAGGLAESAASPSESVRPARERKPRTARTAAPAGKQREGTKHALLIGLLRRPDGVTLAEAVVATGWQAHTVRGAFAGALKKRLGLTIASEKTEGRGRTYRIVA